MDPERHALPRRWFPTTPDLDRFRAWSPHAAALHQWQKAYQDREPWVLLDGESGSGKTVTALHFLQQLPANAQRFFVPSAHFQRPVELFQSILFEAELDYIGLSEHEARLAVIEQVLKAALTVGPWVLVLDEAHHLHEEVLEELRLLGNYSTRQGASVFIGFVALPLLRQRLDKAGWSSTLGQRLCVRPRLQPLELSEAQEYIRHQLLEPTRAETATGSIVKSAMMTIEAQALVAQAGRGLPRLMNQILGLAWQAAQDAGEKQVDAEAVLAAFTQLGLHAEDGQDELPMKPITKPQPGPRPGPMPPAEQRTERTKSRHKAS